LKSNSLTTPLSRKDYHRGYNPPFIAIGKKTDNAAISAIFEDFLAVQIDASNRGAGRRLAGSAPSLSLIKMRQFTSKRLKLKPGHATSI